MENKFLNNKEILHLLISQGAPVFLSLFMQQLYNIADLWVVGALIGANAFAAVGAAGSIINLFLFVLKNYCTKVSTRLARFYGKADLVSFRQEVFMAFFTGALLTCMIGIVCWLGLGWFIEVMKTPSDLQGDLYTYIEILLFGLIFSFLFNLISAVLDSLHHANQTLIFLGVSLILNLILDYIMIGVFNMGIAGAAWATVISQAFSCFLSLILLSNRLSGLFPGWKDRLFDRQEFKKLFGFGRNSFLGKLISYFGKLQIQVFVNTLGTSAVTIYSAASKIEGVFASFGEGASHALSIVIARYEGEYRKENIQKTFHIALLFCLLISLFILMLVFCFSKELIAFLFPKDAGHLIEDGSSFLRIVAVSLVCYILNNVFTGYFYGLGNMKISFQASIIQVILWIAISDLFLSSHQLPVIAAAWGISFFCSLFYQAGMYLIFKNRLLENSGQ